MTDSSSNKVFSSTTSNIRGSTSPRNLINTSVFSAPQVSFQLVFADLVYEASNLLLVLDNPLQSMKVFSCKEPRYRSPFLPVRRTFSTLISRQILVIEGDLEAFESG